MTYSKGFRVTEDSDGDECLPDEQYTLSENQAAFCNDAIDAGLEIDFFYSGRGMYGKYCPAVRCDAPNDIATRANVRTDGMGRGVVVYAQY